MSNKITWKLKKEGNWYDDKDSVEGIVAASGNFRTLLLARGFYKGKELYILDEKAIERPELIEEINRCTYIIKSTREWNAVCHNNEIAPDDYLVNEKFTHAGDTADARLEAYKKAVNFAENDLNKKIKIIAERQKTDYERV